MLVLGTVGIADKGIYNAGTTYTTGNFVLYQGSTWLALKDNLTGIEPEEGENWKYLARGFGSDTLSQILGTDTSGVLGTAGEDVVSQLLIDAIADKVMTKLLPIANLVNNGLTTQAGFALDARYGKTLKDLYDALNSNLSDKSKVIRQSFSFSITVPANEHTYIDVPITIPNGYNLGGFTVYGGDSRHVLMLSAVLVSETVIAVEGRSAYTSDITISGNVNAFFYK